MAKKKLLFIEDLYDILSERKNSYHFSSKKNDELITVQVEGKMKFNNSDGSKDGLMPVHLQANHTGKNVNGSNINDNVNETALSSFKNRPILGYIHEVDGKYHFYGHNMHQDDNGELVYDEVPVGIIPESCNAQLVYDEKKGKTYVEVDGLIFEEYSKAAEIMQREEELSVSVELSIRELSYNAKEKFLDLEDFFYSGVTILGIDENGNKVLPGMEGSNVRLSDFSKSENKIFSDDKLDKMNEKLDELLSHFEIKDNHGKEEFEVDNLKNEVMEEVVSEDEVIETVEESTEEEVVETVEVTESEETEDVTPEEVVELESVEEVELEHNFEKLVRTFEISHDDIRYALYNLLATYEESDNDWYFISNVFDSHFVYENWAGTKMYGQNYTKVDDNVSFDGERYELFKEILTASEKAELENMRANYSSLVEFKETEETKKAHNERLDIMCSDKFEMISEKNKDGEFMNASYKELYENMDKYSCEELDEKLKAIVGEFAISGGKFEKKEKNTLKVFGNVNKSKKRVYGDLFD